MNRKELIKKVMMISNVKIPFGLHGLQKNILRVMLSQINP